MRYQAKWTNGFWKLFDSHQYEDLDIFDRQVEAEAAAANMNARAALRKAAHR